MTYILFWDHNLTSSQKSIKIETKPWGLRYPLDIFSDIYSFIQQCLIIGMLPVWSFGCWIYVHPSSYSPNTYVQFHSARIKRNSHEFVLYPQGSVRPVAIASSEDSRTFWSNSSIFSLEYISYKQCFSEATRSASLIAFSYLPVLCKTECNRRITFGIQNFLR